MTRIRRMGTAAMLAAVLSTGLTFGSVSLQAKGKDGGDPKAAICTYLQQVMTYPYVLPAIRDWASYLYYDVYHCDQ